MNQIFSSMATSFMRRQTKKQTHDGLSKRANAGAVTGGRTFGYNQRRIGDRKSFVHRTIDESEATTVRRIFALYAEGAGLTKIAKTLNAERVPSPRGASGTWAGTAIRDMLRRETYSGVVVWNKTQKLKRGGTDARRKRAPSEWLSRPAPELTIIDADLWQRVQARLAARSTTFLRRIDGKLIGRPSGADVESPYLLSSIAECAECGGSLVAMTRPGRAPYYGCLRNHKRGVHACRNGVQIRQDVLDQAVVDVLAGALDASVLAEAVEAAVAELSAVQATSGARRATLTAELVQIAGRERRLLDAIVDGDGTADTIRGRLREELARRDTVTSELARMETETPTDVAQIMRDVAARAADLRALLGRHVTQARQVVRMLLEGRLVCTPFDDGVERGYAFKAEGTYKRLAVPALTPVNVGGVGDGPPSPRRSAAPRQSRGARLI